jgi:hypothetical protein
MLAVEGIASSQELAVAVSQADSDKNSDQINGLKNDIYQRIDIIKNEQLQPLRQHPEVIHVASYITELQDEAQSIEEQWSGTSNIEFMNTDEQFIRLHAKGPSFWLRRKDPFKSPRSWSIAIHPDELNTGSELLAYLCGGWTKWGCSIGQAMRTDDNCGVFDLLEVLSKWNGDPTRTIGATLDEIAGSIHAFYDVESLKDVLGLLEVFSTIINTYNDRYKRRTRFLVERWEPLDMSSDQGFVGFNNCVSLLRQRSEQLLSAEQLEMLNEGEEALPLSAEQLETLNKGEAAPPLSDVYPKAFFDMVEKSRNTRIAIQNRFEAIANDLQPIKFIYLGILPIEVAASRILDAVKRAPTLSNVAQKYTRTHKRGNLFFVHRRDLPKLETYMKSERRLKQFEQMVLVLDKINSTLSFIKQTLHQTGPADETVPASDCVYGLRYGTEALRAMHQIVELRDDIINTRAQLRDFNPHFSEDAAQQLYQISPQESDQYSWLRNHEYPDLDIQNRDFYRKKILAIRKGMWAPPHGVSPSAEVAKVVLEGWFARWQRDIRENSSECSKQLLHLLNILEWQNEHPVVAIDAKIDDISTNLGQFDDVEFLDAVLNGVYYLQGRIDRAIQDRTHHLAAPVWRNIRTQAFDPNTNPVYIKTMAFLDDLRQTCGGELPELLLNEINEKQAFLFSIQEKYIGLFNMFIPIASDRARFVRVEQVLYDCLAQNNIK